MPRTLVSLDAVRVATPCKANWNEMDGDEHMRHCAECDLFVYDLSSLNRAEAEDLVRSREGRTCVRFFRRADGTVLTQDCPVGIRAWRRKVVFGISAAVMLIVTLMAWSIGLLLSREANRGGPGGGPAAGGAGPSLIERIWETVFPRPPVAPPGVMVMGDICIEPRPGQVEVPGIPDNLPK